MTHSGHPRTCSTPPATSRRRRPTRSTLEQKETVGLSQAQIVRRRFFRHKGAMISLIVLLFVLLLAFTSIGSGPIPGWWQWTPYDRPPPSNPRGEPTLSLPFFGGTGFAIGDHPFGQDETGRDMFAPIMRGIQNTMVVIIVLAILSTTHRRGHRRGRRLLRRLVGRRADAVHRHHHHHPADPDHRRRSASRSAPAAC